MSKYNTSFLQKRVWLLYKRGSMLFSQGLMQIAGNLDTHKLEKAINEIIKSNDVLRTNYITQKGELFPFQMVNEIKPIEIITVDISHISEFEKKFEKLEAYLAEYRKSVPDFEKERLLKLFLFKFSDSVHFLSIIIPAISADSHTIISFMKKISSFYVKNDNKFVNAEVVQYPQFAGWQENLIESPEKEAVDFWQAHNYKNYEPSDNLLIQDSIASLNYLPLTLKFKLEDDIVDSIKKLADQLRCNPSSIALACVFALNYFKSLSPGLIGYVLSKRNYEELEDTFGLVSKTVPLGVANFEDITFADFVIKLDKHIEEVIAWQDYFSSVNSSPSINGKPYGYPFGFEFMDIKSQFQSDENIQFILKDIFSTTDVFKLKLSIVDIAGEWLLNFIFNTHDFSIDEIEEYKQQYINLLINAVANDSLKLTTISVSDADTVKSLENFNHDLPSKEYRTITEIFEEQVTINPNGVAVVSEGMNLSYHELNAQANSIAAKLRSEGAGPGDIIGILADRSAKMIVGIIGVIKSGAAYLPIDVNYPAERITYLLTDSKVKILLVTKDKLENLSSSIKQMEIDSLILNQKLAVNPAKINNAEDIAYVMYTSGSSGKPKGVMVEHRNLHSLVNSLHSLFYQNFKAKINIGLVASFSFDGSIKQIFSSLLLGHTLHIVPDDIKQEGNQLIKYFIDNKLDVTDVTPLHFDILLNENIQTNKIGIKYFLCGGQQLFRRTVEKLKEKYEPFTIVNLYGPTECCVDATFFTITENTLLTTPIIPIGKPIENTQIYILDENKKQVPPGIIGEIYIGGHGVSRGYLNQPEHTAERFVHLSLSKGRLYKTGDLGKWNRKGIIEFVGRNDAQVKVRGYRIELDEVQETILRIPKIKDCVVAIKKDKNMDDILVAYLILQQKINLTEIYNELKDFLPAYMIPSSFVRLKKIPMTINGKVDRNALPHPDGISMQTETKYEAPRNIIETKLVEILEDLLGRTGIGINDNFYEIGGDSIKAVQMSARLYRIGYKIDIRELFLNPSIAQIAPKVTEISEHADQSVITGEVEMSPIQKHYFSKPDVDMHHFNQSVCFHSTDRINKEHIQMIFLKIVEHHDELRALFKIKNGKIVQSIEPIPRSLEVTYIDLTTVLPDQQEAAFEESKVSMQGKLVLDSEILVKLVLYRLKDEDRLLVILHHLVSDGFSWRILFEDIAILFNQLKQNTPLQLPLKTDSYKAWTSRLVEYSNSNEFIEKSKFWKQLTAENLQVIPKDQKENTCFNYNVSAITAELDEDLTGKLLNQVNQAYKTEINEIILCAFGLAVKECFDIPKVGVYLVGHGRDEVITGLNITRTVGWFNNIYPLIIDVTESQELDTAINKVKTDIRAIPDKGFGYGILKFITDEAKKMDFYDNVKPNIMFNYLGQFDTDIKTLPFSVGSVNGGAISLNRQQRFEIVVGAMVANNRFRLSIEFNKKQYSESLMSKLHFSFQENLKLLINHCVNSNDTTYN